MTASTARRALAALRAGWREVSAKPLDLIYPPRCVDCGAPAQAFPWQPFCPSCAENIESVTPPWCPMCGEPYPNTGPGGVSHPCPDCADRAPPFDIARSALYYQGPVGAALRALKYRNEIGLGKLFGFMVAWTAASLNPRPGALVVPMPLWRGRERQRGYNQAGVIAYHAARFLGLPFVPAALRRVRDTATQVTLPRAERAGNVRGAFAPGSKAKRAVGAEVILVDDVFTTGATCREAAAALRAAGAARVLAVTVARVETG